MLGLYVPYIVLAAFVLAVMSAHDQIGKFAQLCCFLRGFSAFRGETLKKYVLDFAGVFSHTLTRFFLCARRVFGLRKDGILYFINLRSDGFRWSPWHVDNHSVRTMYFA